MGRFIFGYDDESLLATYQSANNFQTNIGVSQLNINYSSAVMRTDDLAPLVIEIDHAADHTFSTLGIVNHNFSPAATVEFQAFSDSNKTNQIYTTGPVTVGDYAIEVAVRTLAMGIPDTQSAHWKLLVTDAANPDGYLQIGTLFMGKRFHPDCNMDYGLRHGVEDQYSTRFTSDQGVDTFLTAPKKRTANFALSNRSLDEGNEFFRMMLSTGITRRVLYQFDEDDNINGLYTFMGTLSQLSPLDYPYFQANAMNLSIRELT